MSDDVILTPQERRLLSIEERLIHLEKKMTIVLTLLSDVTDTVNYYQKQQRSSAPTLKPLNPNEGGV